VSGSFITKSVLYTEVLQMQKCEEEYGNVWKSRLGGLLLRNEENENKERRKIADQLKNMIQTLRDREVNKTEDKAGKQVL
jgi:hypothetical protein